EIFDQYKNVIDGKLSRDQVVNAVRAAGLVPTGEEVSRVLGRADDQNSNSISFTFEELCSIYEQLAQKNEDTHAVIQLFPTPASTGLVE
uniref:Uncharacterized protein n=1 Tax=Acrobeloides nanus TaxID=290746 RepID=A0A914DAI2_9BILA